MSIRLAADMNSNDGAQLRGSIKIFGMNLLFPKTSNQRFLLHSRVLLTSTF
jgi:hypothetical protein